MHDEDGGGNDLIRTLSRHALSLAITPDGNASRQRTRALKRSKLPTSGRRRCGYGLLPNVDSLVRRANHRTVIRQVKGVLEFRHVGERAVAAELPR